MQRDREAEDERWVQRFGPMLQGPDIHTYVYIYIAHPPHDRPSWGRGRVEQ